LAEGDSVRVSILKVEREKRRMTLSLKALGDDPWKNITERYEPDAIVSGRVTRLQDYGAFVELEEGVEGLVHISEMSDRRIHRVSDVLEEGQVVKVRIKGIDLEQRRVSLSLKGTTEEQDAPEAPPEAAPRPEPKKQKKKRPLRGGLTF
jgi:small subunit ribosomal protein S1